ncbi:MAG TPA: PAS domain-containing protein [Opitutaceae bacterium]|nr:PAS domain-containing protein [Opitutaceae bacterium]
MPTSLDEKLRRAAGIAGIVVGGVGLLALLGWAWGVDLLRWFHPEPSPMEGRPALCFLLGGASLCLAYRGRFPRLGAGCALVMFGVAIASIVSFVTGRIPGAPGNAFPHTEVVLALLALALMALAQGKSRAQQPVSLWLAGLVVSFAAAAFFTLSFPPAEATARQNLLSLHVSLGSLVLGIGAILARPEDKFVRLFFAPTASGMLARRLFFGAVLVPAVVSRLFILLVLNDVVRLNDGVLLLASVMIVCGFVITLFSAGAAVSQDEWRENADRERRELTARLEQQAAQLQEMVAQRTRELHEANTGLSAAAESNARLALVANHTTNSVVIANAEGCVEWCNGAFERLTGYLLAEIKGKQPGQVLQGSGTDVAVANQLSQAVRRGETCKVEILHYAKGGRPYWAVVDLEPVRDRTGRVINFVSIQIDITEERLAKQRLQTLNQRLEIATRAAELGVWEWDHIGRKFLWDQRMLQIHGVKPELFGGTFDEWARDVHPEDRARAVGQFNAIIAEGDDLEFAFRLLSRADGTVRFLEARGLAQRDKQGRLVSLTGTCRDITADREATLQMASLNERLKLALSSSNYGVWEYEIPTKRITWDDRMFQIYGVPPEVFDGRRDLWQQSLHVDDREAATDLSLKVVAGDVPRYDTKFRIVHPDGSVRHIEAHGYLQRDSKGTPLRFVGLNRDITAETQMIEALKLAEERWQLAIEGTNDAVWDWNVQTGSVFHDERWASMLGLEPIEAPYTLEGWRQLTHPDDIPLNAHALEEHFAGRSPFYEQELRLRAKNGEWKWILDRGKVVARTVDGRPLRMAGTHTDITERKRLEQRLRRMEELAAQVSQLAQIGGWELELASDQLTWSGVVNQVFELPPDFSPTLPAMLRLFPADARATLETALRAARASGASFDLELPATSAKGRRIWVRVLGKPDAHDRRTVSVLGAMQDITARHESEDSRRRLEEQLFQAQKMETLGTLAGGIAHDFNNLLTGIIGYHELATDSIDANHPAHAFLLEARNASLRARELVDQILTFGRQTGGIEHGPVDLPLVIEEARRFLRATIPTTVAIEAEVGAEGFRVLADATQIHQVILNLGSNAAHAMRAKGGTVRISLHAEQLTVEQSTKLGGVATGKYVRISVADSGHGMDATTMRRIFEPFFTTKNTREGTGLGLAVVHGIVRAHRGAITVESEVGVGSTFHIYLPAAEAENPAAITSFMSAPGGAGELICVVDDEEIVGSCTKLALEGKGYKAVFFTSAAQCLETISKGNQPIQLLLTDQTMPGMQGIELAAALRKSRPDLPVVIMSGYFSKISSAALDELGGVQLLAKPFTADELAQAVNRSLHPNQAGD